MNKHDSDPQLGIQSPPLEIRRRSRSRKFAVCLTTTSAILASAWFLGISPSEWKWNFLLAASKPDAASANKDSDGEKKVKLNYISASWARVFQDLAETGDLEVVADKMPPGRFSRMDKTEYTRKEAMRIINKELQPHGLRLIEKAGFLILLEISAPRIEYPPAVLPKKKPPKPVEENEDANDRPAFRAETISKPKDDVQRADYREDVSDSSSRRRRNGPRDTASDSNEGSQRRSNSRNIRQASLQEPERSSARKTHPFDSSAPAEIEGSDAPAPTGVYRPRNLTALDLSKRIYRAMKADAEQVDSGRNGLPGFRVVNPQFQSKNSDSSDSEPARPIDFLVSINELKGDKGELLVDGGSRDVNGVLKLLREIDRPVERNVRTHIKASTPYACQVADQLPLELDRIRAAAGTKVVAKHPLEGRPVWVADQNQQRVPGAGAPNDQALPETPDDLNEPDEPVNDALGNLKGDVTLEVIPDLNVIVIRGNQRDVDQILKVIKQIEELSEATAPQVHLLHLTNVDSESMAELLTSVFDRLTRFPGQATQPRQSVAIMPVTKPNALLIVAPKADLDNILDMVQQLDQPVDPQTEFQVFRLKAAPATDVETLITEFYKDRRSLGVKVLVIADPRSNSVIVRAAPRDLDEITALLKKVDRDDVLATNKLKIFVLKNAIATDVAAVINAAIQNVLSAPRSSGGGGGGGGAGGAAGGQGGNAGLGGQVDEQFKTSKSTNLLLEFAEKGETKKIRSGILADIRVTPDTHTNAVIVSASEKSMDLVEALIRTLDKPSSTTSVIKVFTLANADAAQMVNQLNALFNNQQQGTGQGTVQQRALVGVVLASADDASSSLVPLRFSVDTRTNSVIAVGSPDAMSVVHAVLLKLDENNQRMRQNEVIRLNNAPAATIGAAITQFFQQQRDLSQNADPNLVSNVEQLEREVIVIPDTVSNNLLISATPRYFDGIRKMITALDKAPRQVIIQALIVEVQLNNTDEFGLELGLQSPVLFNRSLLQTPVTIQNTNSPANSGGQILTNQLVLSQESTPGFNFNNPGIPLGNNVASFVGASPGVVGGQGLTNFSLGRNNQDLGYGGLVLSAGSQSVNALLRALSSNHRVQILSRPQIRALDSQQAEVFVGQTIPTVTNFITNQTTGVLTPTLTQRQTGIGMQIMPRINQEGSVVIYLYAYRSQLSKETIAVTTDSRGQPLGQRITDLSEVRTTVLVPANNTIVIGGMINSRDETSVRKAPLLGDIPILGHLFRYDSRSTTRAEMLIFLTPRIVDGPDEEECLKEIEMARLHFSETEAEEVHGPLRAIPAPDELFDGENPNWISPGIPIPPPSPATTVSPTPMNAYPTPTPTPTPAPTQDTSPNAAAPTDAAPPSPMPPSPTPPAPDPNVTQINAQRTKTIENDGSKDDSVTTANYTEVTRSKSRWLKPKSDAKNQKKAASSGSAPAPASDK